MIKQLKPKEYAALLCETIEDYKYPAVTYDFVKNKEICHGSMYGVEKYIGDLLRSQNTQEIEDGLANVLYWGYAKNNTRDSKICKFRKANVLNNELSKFMKLIKNLITSTNNNGTISGGKFLLTIAKNKKIPQFGISFTSKVLMFIDPIYYPVLDTKIAKRYARKSSFRPLEDLKIYNNIITKTKKNEPVYNYWACWCREIAIMINASPQSTCNHFRAVDVERALFTLANSNKISASLAAESLLAGPANFNIKCP